MRSKRAVLPGLLFGLGLLTGCGDDSAGPGDGVRPDLSTPRAAIRALADLYGRRLFQPALALHAEAFRFYPARPESVPFFGPGETSWAIDRETMILERLLVPHRISWIDQVLLEPVISEVVDSTETVTRITARTDLTFLVGTVDLVHSRSWVDFIYEKNADGDWILLEQRERLFSPTALPVGELKTQVEKRPSVATLAVDADSVSSTRAVIPGRVNPNGLATTYYFEWGTTSSYGMQSAAAPAGSDFAVHVFEHVLTGLAPGTEYHYRIVAESLWGTSRGIDLTFTTTP